MKMRRLLLWLLTVVFICGTSICAHAQARSSDYFNGYYVSAHQGDGWAEIDIEADITANWSVPKIGVLKIEIYRSNGSHVTTIQGTTSNGLLSPKNNFCHGVIYTYRGVPGTSYYAIVTLCAGTNTDYDTRVVRTQTVRTTN